MVDGPQDPFEHMVLVPASLEHAYLLDAFAAFATILTNEDATVDEVAMEIHATHIKTGERISLVLMVPRDAREAFIERIQHVHFLDEECAHRREENEHG